MKAMKFLGVAALLLAMTACGGNKQKTEEAEAADETFYAAQPVESGIYDATYFDIKGKDARKGQFDGRVIISVSPEQSALYVYENGNRTKIKKLLMLDSPLEKTDSIYTSLSKGQPVSLAKDSADYVLNYIANSDTVSITFSQKARNSYTPIEALEKIQQESSK